MSAATDELVLPEIPLDVAKFAAKRDFTRYLRPLAAAAMTAYPGCRVRYYMEEDAEIEGDWRIILEADVSGRDDEWIQASLADWDRNRFEACPPNQVGIYCFRLEYAP